MSGKCIQGRGKSSAAVLGWEMGLMKTKDEDQEEDEIMGSGKRYDYRVYNPCQKQNKMERHA